MRTAILLLIFVSFQLYAEPVMRVHFIDVGQGDASLLEFSCGAVLIDTGGEKNGDFDSTEALITYLDDFFDRRTDLHRRLTSLILTHPHIDHTRGVKEVLKEFKPMNGVTNAQGYGSGKYGQRYLHEYLYGPDGQDDTADDLPYQDVLVQGFTNPTDRTNGIIDPINCGQNDDPVITALWGGMTQRRDWGKKYGKYVFDNNNNHSVAIRVDYGEASILFTGDMEDHALDEFVQRNSGTHKLDVDVYQVGHHGSINGTTQELVDEMTPAIAVISMGPPDRHTTWTAWDYGHPRKEIVEMLENKVSLGRENGPIDVMVGTGSETFEEKTNLRKAIYATGWDGDVVLESKTDGFWHLVKPQSTALLNINAATYDELIELPQIGPSRAQAIIDYRSNNGNFSSIDDLDEVPGIGPATIATIREFVEVR